MSGASRSTCSPPSLSAPPELIWVAELMSGKGKTCMLVVVREQNRWAPGTPGPVACPGATLVGGLDHTHILTRTRSLGSRLSRLVMSRHYLTISGLRINSRGKIRAPTSVCRLLLSLYVHEERAAPTRRAPAATPQHAFDTVATCPRLSLSAPSFLSSARLELLLGVVPNLGAVPNLGGVPNLGAVLPQLSAT